MSDLGVVLQILRGDADEVTLIEQAAVAAGDEIHRILKGHAMTMPTSRAAIALGCHASAQMLCEAIEFGERTVGDPGEGVLVRRAALELFRTLVESKHPGCFDRRH